MSVHLSSHPDPCVMVIFGASGDLTKRLLVPALVNLAQAELLPRQFAIVGFSFDNLTTESYRAKLTEDIKSFATSSVDPKTWEWFVERIYYVQGSFDDKAAYGRLKETMDQASKEHGIKGSRFFYLAVAPRFFGPCAQELGEAGLLQEAEGQWSRVIVEKPFGRDLDSAKQLNRDLRKVLKESQIYRIDHYLGKETVQNIMVLRFGNSIFEPIWNRHYIDHVQITAGEIVGVEKRGGYYETSGAMRDMVPNHLFQLVTLTAMEAPISFDADEVRSKQAEVLHAVTAPSPEDVLSLAVRGQYGEGMRGADLLPAYRNEQDVDPESATDTFVALKLRIDNWRWADVPFYIRTGKRLNKRVTKIVVHFRRTPTVLFRNTSAKLHPNSMMIYIQPEERISIRFGAKKPGPIMDISEVVMDFDYHKDFGSVHATGYERLLHDCMIGDATLFQRADVVEAGWGVIRPVMDVWKALPPRNFPNYESASWGPHEADEMLHRDGREWTND